MESRRVAPREELVWGSRIVFSSLCILCAIYLQRKFLYEITVWVAYVRGVSPVLTIGIRAR